jgi:hypothetical protein
MNEQELESLLYRIAEKRDQLRQHDANMANEQAAMSVRLQDARALRAKAEDDAKAASESPVEAST